MSGVTTMPAYLWPLMAGASMRAGHCVVCGRTGCLEQHHVVYRSQGQLYRGGVRLPKPTLTLCGPGNAGGCHGLAHAHLLHFRWVPSDADARPDGFRVSPKGGHWEWLRTDSPVREFDALRIGDGWRRCR